MAIQLNNTASPLTGQACPGCQETTLTEKMVTEQMAIGPEGATTPVEIPVISCSSCDLTYADHRAEGLRHAAACRHQGVMAPQEVKEVRAALRMTREEFSAAYGIPPASLERWENGRLIQNKSSDTLLRLLMDPTVAAKADRRELAAPVVHSNVIYPDFHGRALKAAALEDAQRRGETFQLRAHG